MITPQFILCLAAELVIDLFAGGGGMSTGIECAIGRHVDIAINHNPDALSLHQANHPQTKHLIGDVREVCPRVATEGRPVGLLHLSPDCTHHSQAKGGQPRDAKMRALSWVGIHWAGTVRPRIITLENVKQIQQWGPMIAKRCQATGRVITLDMVINPATGKKEHRVADPGERVPLQNQFLVPDPKRVGKTWRRFTALLRDMGYDVEARVLRASDHNTPTTRERLFMTARCDGVPITWPEPTHHKVPARGQKRWRAAAEAIDWSIPSRSIFGRDRPLVEATLRRTAHGLWNYVLNHPEPFIVRIGQTGGKGSYVRPGDQPLSTVVSKAEHLACTPVMVQASHGDGQPGGVQRWGKGYRSATEPVGTVTASGADFALATATMVQMGYGEREGQAPRSLDLAKPLGTVVAGGIKHGLVTGTMVQANGGFNTTPARDLRSPVSTTTTSGSQQQLVVAHLAELRKHCDLVDYSLSQEQEAGALQCAAFLMRYHGTGGQWSDLREPMTTITTRDRIALVTVWLKGEPWVIVDICLRMLEPRELYNANGFPPDYIIDRGHDGRRFTKAQQVRMVGNSVPPTLAEAYIHEVWHARAPELMAA